MIVIEILGEIIGRIFVEFIFHGIILGIYRLFKKGIEFIRVKIFGLKAKPIKPKKALEKKLLYKNIELTENLNSELKVGQKGVILEVIDKNKVFAEFYDRNGKQIELNNELVFEIGIKQFKLKK
ncbi:hypothetical protein [Tenacibaculum retecalamus]|uniref:hypothetical protein n=1 Tax=Tenacibaculum retecalamus TaxID=3018315 RepID=UPI0023D92AAC|nr:hypothetical protein [Tenacibaculum retecalamus]WBX70382.1 hypothetical protein PG912_08835 [Tenacibaculum retecalamus]